MQITNSTNLDQSLASMFRAIENSEYLAKVRITLSTHKISLIFVVRSKNNDTS